MVSYIERLRDSPLAKRLWSGSAWSIGGAVSGKALTLASSIYVARLLGKETFGEFGIVQSTFFSFVLFAGMGLGLTSNRYAAQYRTTDPGKAGRIISLSYKTSLATGLITAFLVFIYSDELAIRMMASTTLAPKLRIVSIALLFGALNGAMTGTLSGLEAFQKTAKIAVITGVASFTFMIVGSRIAGLTGAVSAISATSLVTFLANLTFLRRELRKNSISTSFRSDYSELPILWKFSIPAVLSGLSVVPVNWLCNVILVNQPNGYAEMGILNATIQWRNIILFVPSILMSVTLPILTNLGATGEHKKQHKVLGANIATAALIGLSAALCITFTSKLIMASYGPEFTIGSTTLVLQAFAAAIAAITGVIGQFLISKGKMWHLILLQLIWGSIYIGLTWQFKSHGAEGVSQAYLVSFLVHLINISIATFFLVRTRAISSN
jgi:O-antigen/teichoic acid export membrane protein